MQRGSVDFDGIHQACTVYVLERYRATDNAQRVTTLKSVSGNDREDVNSRVCNEFQRETE